MQDKQKKKISQNGKGSPDGNTGKKLLQWHPAFFAGLQIELSEEAEYLSFENEHLLSSKPMQMDMLIIKKDKERQIKKNIGRIFRTHNIVEYKSPEDSLTIDDFYKVYGYTCFYKADTGKVNEIQTEELTISFVCGRYPREMMWHLTQEEHRVMEQKENGIYYIQDSLFPVQLIVTKQLSEKNNLWLKSLTNNLESDRAAAQLLRAYEKHRTEGLYQSVMDVVIRANKERFMVNDMREMCEALEELLDEKAAILAEERAVKIAEERAVKMAEERAVKMAEERAAKMAEERAAKMAEEKLLEMLDEQKKLAEERAVKLAEEKAVKLTEEIMKQGVSQGEQQKILTLIQRKIKKGKSLAQIADDLEETEDTILPLYNRLREEEGSYR